VSTTALDNTAHPDRFAGELLVPGDPSYDEARTVFNAMVDRRPAMIARCTGPADVAAAIDHARTRGLEIAVRGGGHGVAGTALSEGGLVVDLTLMRTVTVDPQARTATVAGGARMADLDRAAQPHGLATTGGRVSTTGVAGLTLGGGNGWLDRRFGLACDNLLTAELVTADGTIVRADQSQNPELFWALHGGGGNFGVATSLTFRLHPLTTVTVAKLLWGAAAAPGIARAFRDVMESAPDELGGAFAVLTAPPAEVVPPHLTGRLACAVILIYTGTGPAAWSAMAPLLGLGHEGGLVAEVPYADFQCMNEDPPGHRNHWTAEHLSALPDEAIDAFCAHAADLIVPSPSALVLIPQGGALARGPAEYPIPWRQAPWHAAHFAMWTNAADDERARAGARSLRTAMAAWTSGEVYLNYIGDEGRDRVVAGLGAANLERLAAVKAIYDPDNLFHLNHNIPPATSA
jgi:FAD/FMN-containing dehydrogenase